MLKIISKAFYEFIVSCAESPSWFFDIVNEEMIPFIAYKIQMSWNFNHLFIYVQLQVFS